MRPLPAPVAYELGRRLREAGFRPLPDVADDGELIGARLWRVRAGYVEYLALRPNGLAHAVRAEAASTTGGRPSMALSWSSAPATPSMR